MKHTIVPALMAGLLPLALSACTHFGYTDFRNGPLGVNPRVIISLP